MPTYQTAEPIDVAVDVAVGRVDVVAGERTDTVVTVAPSNPARSQDVRGAAETRVDFDGTRLTVAGPRRFSLIGPSESIDVTIEVPAGSRLTADVSVGPIRTTGRLGATRIKSATGFVDLDTTGDLQVDAAQGGVTIAVIDGRADIKSGNGSVEIGIASGDILIKALHGAIRMRESAGAVDATLSHGNLDIERAGGSVVAKTSYGNVRLAVVTGPSVRIETSYGLLSVGVPEGVAVWLDAASKIGRVRNELGADRAPEPGEPTLEVRARTQGGDVLIHRAR